MTARDDYSRDEITTILRLKRAGVPMSEICAQHNISQSMFLRWQNMYESGLSSFTNTNRRPQKVSPLLDKLLNRHKR